MVRPPFPNPNPNQTQTNQNKQSTPPLQTNSALTLSLLTSLGGIIGYTRTGSVPSIAAGLAVGALYLYSYLRLSGGAPYGTETGLFASVVLGGSSVPRAIKTRKGVPIGLSVLAVYGAVVFGRGVWSA